MELSIIGYDPIGAWSKKAETVEELLSYRNPSGMTWINVEGLDDHGMVQKIAEAYNIHPLTLEDILDTSQRPKAEEFDDYVFLTFRAFNRVRSESENDVIFEKMNLIVMESTLITFQEIEGDSFDGIRKRILNSAAKIRKMPIGYLTYAILDAVVDDYFIVLNKMGQDLEDFEDIAMDEEIKEQRFLSELQDTKKELNEIRRIVWPVRDSLSLLIHTDTPLFPDEMDPYLKDVYDAVIQAVDTIDGYRDHISGIMEIRLSMNSYRMNGVMKVLTIISTIFIPLTFIVGVYGMNFKYMPELQSRLGYPLVWLVMLGIVGGMIAFFKHKKWF